MEKYLFRIVICNILAFVLSVSVYGQTNKTEDNNLLTLNSNENTKIYNKEDGNSEDVSSVATDAFIEEYKKELRTSSNAEIEEALMMVAIKSQLMDKKMDLINQKMLLALEFMYSRRVTKQDEKDYIKAMQEYDQAIEDTQTKIQEVDALMGGVRKR